MRVTNAMLVNNMLRNIGKNLYRLEKVQQQASTGKKIQYASENPIIATRAVKIQNYVSDIQQLQKNTDDAKSWMNFSESVLNQLNSNLKRVRELTVEAANDTYTDEDRATIKAEIIELEKSILELGNSSYSGRYVFAGYDTDTAPFETVSTAVGDKIMYRGKYLSLGGTVAGTVSDADLEAFYLQNMDKISGQPELTSAKYQAFTAAAPALDFTITLDGVSQTISLTNGTDYDIGTLQTELQSKINAAFPPGAGQPDPLIKVSTDSGKLKLTVQDGTSIKIESGTLDVKNMGFASGTSSIAGSKQEILYKIGSGNRVSINVEGNEIFGQGGDSIFDTLAKLKMALDGEASYKTATYEEGTGVVITTGELDISSLLDDLDEDINRILKCRADLGARTNYVELTQDRLDTNYATFTELLSKNIDADYAEVSMRLASAEAVYTAALLSGAKVIQPSLLDFLD